MKPKGYHILEVSTMDKIFEETKLRNPCKYNIGVSCSERECKHCGWNPAVEQERKEKLREKFGYTK